MRKQTEIPLIRHEQTTGGKDEPNILCFVEIFTNFTTRDSERNRTIQDVEQMSNPELTKKPGKSSDAREV